MTFKEHGFLRDTCQKQRLQVFNIKRKQRRPAMLKQREKNVEVKAESHWFVQGMSSPAILGVCMWHVHVFERRPKDKGEGFTGAQKTLESRREPLQGTDLSKVRAEAGNRCVCSFEHKCVILFPSPCTCFSDVKLGL